MNWRKLALNLLPPLVVRPPKSLISSKRPGLNGLDSRLEQYLDVARPGYFVELGANDGYAQSNTWFLENDYGWRGVLIEPSPIAFIDLIRNRSRENYFACAACVAFDQTEPFVRMRFAGLMTVTYGPTDLPEGPGVHTERGRRFLPEGVRPFDFAALARTLQSILDEIEAPPHIDLLSLDVEGFELSVLRGVAHSRSRFGHMIVESRSPDVLTDYLASVNYRMVAALSHHDYLFEDALC